MPLNAHIAHGGSARIIAPGAIVVSWEAGTAATLRLAANLSAAAVGGFPSLTGTTLWSEGEWSGDRARAWSIRWSIAERR